MGRSFFLSLTLPARLLSTELGLSRWRPTGKRPFSGLFVAREVKRSTGSISDGVLIASFESSFVCSYIFVATISGGPWKNKAGDRRETRTRVRRAAKRHQNAYPKRDLVCLV